MNTIALTGLVRIDLPAETLRFCDGGFIVWDSATWRTHDAVWGAIESISALDEGVGNTLPAIDLTFLPPAATGPGDVADPVFQNSRVRVWLAEYVPATGLVSGSPTLLFDGQIDQVVWQPGRAGRRCTVACVTRAEKLFSRNIGNSLSPSFHKSIWPGETGHDNATGLSIPVAWGVESAVNGAGAAGRPQSFVEALRARSGA